jgi:photosystem II stability/assembly factor-like uncharacterized protein
MRIRSCQTLFISWNGSNPMKHITMTALALALAQANAHAQWQKQTIGSSADFRGLAVVSKEIAWASGTQGTFAHTIDGGKHWQVGTVPQAAKLDFRDVKAFGKNTAYLMSAGAGPASRIYKTEDGGASWSLQFTGSNPETFLDALAFWDQAHGIALGDPVKGKFELIGTADGGIHWKPLTDTNLPAALANEGAFAASGSCLVAHGSHDVWFGTGGGKAARVFHSDDRGQTWTASETPVSAGIPSAGIFSVAFRDSKNGLIVGGNYARPDELGATAARTTDGGKTWALFERRLPYRSAVGWAKDRWIVVGTSGSNASVDEGTTWKQLDHENYNAVGFTQTGEGWAVGPKGRIARFER